MGKLIEKLATQADDEVVYVQDLNFEKGNIGKASVAIIFSQPQAAVSNIKFAFQNGLNVICGTTGWLEHYPEITELTGKMKRGFLYASNFSVGVNLFFELNKKLAIMIRPLKAILLQ